MNTARQIATDVRNAYRGHPWWALAAILLAGLGVVELVATHWLHAAQTGAVLVLFVILQVTEHERDTYQERADEYLGRWADLDEDLDELDNLLAVERVKVDKLEAALETSERYRAERETELNEAYEDIDGLRIRLDSIPTTGADIRRMCEAFGQDVHDELHKPDGDVRALRIALLVEEVKEYLAAEQADNIVEIADGLADVVVIAYGTACAYGIDLDAVLAEVYRSNMTKVVDGEVQYREDGKVLKPDSWEPPAVADVIGHMDGDPWSEQVAA